MSFVWNKLESIYAIREMKYIVTGASSFIGTEFTKLLLECGNEVYAVCRNVDKAKKMLSNDSCLHIVCVSLDEYAHLYEMVPTADVFIHFAWDGTSINQRDAKNIHRNNVRHTMEAMAAARKIGCKLFVDTGSQAEYGVVIGKISETTPCNPFSEYGKAKLAVYNKGVEYCREVGIKYLHLRIFSVFGEYDHEHTLVMSGLKNLLCNEPLNLSDCTQKWNFLYIRDAVKQIYKLCASIWRDNDFVSDVYNIASNDTRILKEFVEKMKELTRSSSELVYGAKNPVQVVTLDPDTSKIYSRIKFIADYSFDEAIKLITDRMRNKNLEIKEFNRGGVKYRHCLVCGMALNNKPLLSFHNMPSSAQNIPTADELNSDKGIDIALYQCKRCGLVQLDATPVSYYKKVIRAGGGSVTMRTLRYQQYSELFDRFDLKGKKLIEIGCGKGEFLKIWNDFDIRAIGIEYDKELVNVARSEGLEVYKAYADDADTELPEAMFDAFVQFNFLEHQPDPNGMLQCIYNNLVDNGVGLVTVPSLEYILKYDGYYELIRDHLAYYSEGTLRFLFEKNGFEVVDCKTINRDTHAIIVRKRTNIDVSTWESNYNTLRVELHEYVNSYIKEGKKVAVWGASHQGFTLLSSMELSDKIAYIIDSAPFKQGRYSPASHLPIVDRAHFRQEPVDSILIIAPGYTDEISNIIRTEMSHTIDIRTLRSNHLEKI